MPTEVAPVPPWVDVGPARGNTSFHVAWSMFDNDVAGTFSTRDDTISLYLLEERTERILGRQSLMSATGGRVALDPPAQWTDGTAEGLSSGVWITHPACEPRFVGLGPGEAPAALLEAAVPAPLARIVVRDGEGNPIAGARVRQQALPLADYRSHGRDLRAIGRRALVVDSVTDASGGVARLPLGGPAAIEAFHEDMRARVLTDGEQRDLEVQLVGRWSLSGTVRGVADAGPWALVHVAACRGSAREPLGAASVRADGAYGPLELPCIADVERYEVRLDHGTVVPKSRSLAPPSAGDQVVVDFHVVAGRQLWMQVVAEEGRAPIDGAEVTWSWIDEETHERSATRSVTGPEGYAEFANVPDGETSVSASANGYATSPDIAIDVGADTPQALLVTLERPARVAGRIEYGDARPVGFAVYYGRRGASPLPNRLAVRSPTDGTFKIDGLPPGELALQAILYGQRATRLEILELVANETTQVVLAPLPTATVVGRVLDASTGAPLVGAAPAIVLLGDGDRMSLGLVEVATDSDGRFELTAVPVTGAALDIWADGYEVFWQRLPQLNPDARLDVGDVPMIRQFAVRVELEGSVDDPGRYGVRLHGESQQLQVFGDDRGVELSGATRDGSVVLVHPTGVEDLYVGAAARARTGPVTVRADEGDLHVEFVDGQGRELNYWGSLQLFWSNGSGQDVVRTLDVASRTSIDTPAVPSESVAYVARSYDGGHSRADTVALQSGGPLVIRLSDEVAGLRIVEPSGEPVRRASVLVHRVVGLAVNSEQIAVSDDEGMVGFAPSAGAHYVAVSTTDGRSIYARPLRELRAGATTDVVVDAVHALRVRVTADGAAASNAPYALALPYGSGWLEIGATNLGGELALERVGPDPLLLVVDVPGRWPVSRMVQPSPVPLALEAWRTATLDLRVVDVQALPVPEVSVALEHGAIRHFDRVHGELGGDVARWMEAGLLPVTPLRTDGAGRLVVQGLPTGEYRVRASLGADRWVDGQVTVSSESDGISTIVLP